MDAGLLVVRVVVGLLMAAHGAQKLFGWFGGYGLTGTGQFFEGLGFKPGRFFAALASGAEVLGGLLIALGFFGPVGPAIVLSVMIVGAVTVHWNNGVFAQNSGIEVPLLYATVSVALALAGYGWYSADTLFGLTSLWTPAVNWAALLVGIVGGFGNLALRQAEARQQVVA
jgi:putative oxidoreductase